MRVHTNPAAVKTLESTRETEQTLRAAAERGRAYAETIAPVDTGEYKASFHVTTGRHGQRVYARVSNSAPHARFVEWPHRVHHSTRIVAGQHILGRSIDALRTT